MLDRIRQCQHFPGRSGGGGYEHKFLGDGQVFKGKLIGVLEVPEARGDRMCQNAIQELKMAIRASGEHKQKVVIHIAVDGLKIRDERTGVFTSLLTVLDAYTYIEYEFPPRIASTTTQSTRSASSPKT